MHTLKLSEIIRDLLSQGWHPKQVQEELQRRGIRWSFSYPPGHQSIRQRTRNLKRIGQKPCELCGQGFDLASPALVCPTCLAQKWGAGVTV